MLRAPIRQSDDGDIENSYGALDRLLANTLAIGHPESMSDLFWHWRWHYVRHDAILRCFDACQVAGGNVIWVANGNQRRPTVIYRPKWTPRPMSSPHMTKIEHAMPAGTASPCAKDTLNSQIDTAAKRKRKRVAIRAA